MLKINFNFLKKKLNEIERIISTVYETKNEIGGVSGLSGISFFLFYYAKFKNDNQQSEKASQILLRVFEQVNRGDLFPAYSNGFSGFGWIINHLNQEGFVEVDDTLLVDTDEYLFTTMQMFLKKKGNYDFLHGAIGCGFYFLKRYKNTPSKELRIRYKTYLTELINSLVNLSEIDKCGIKWLSIIDIETGEKGYNLSLSHGISSIVNFLSRLYLYEDFKNSVEDLLKGGVNYILSYKSKNINGNSFFPNYIKLDNKTKWNSRVAWCYGDLGIGLSLWKASKALKDEPLEKEAIKILKHTSHRRLQKETMVMDAGLCHGSFGNAQIFNYMYRQTKIEEFKNAAGFWINDGLAKATHKDGYAGFKKETQDGWENEIYILTGIAGIGLAIISHLSEDDLNWDECLMIS